MTETNASIFGIFTKRTGVESAVKSLKEAGFGSGDISVLYPYNLDAPHEGETRAPEGPVTGAETGAITGGVLGSILGIGMLGIPGVGPFLAAGPIVAALACVSVSSAIGGIAGGLVGMGISNDEAKRYEGRVRHKGILLSIHNLTVDLTVKAREILVRTGAEDTSSTTQFADTRIGVAVAPAAPLSNQAVADYVSPSKSLEETQTLKTYKPSKAAEYVSPSQPLDVQKKPHPFPRKQKRTS